MMADQSAPALVPDKDAIRADLQWMTRRWSELGQPVWFEVRALGAGQPQTLRYRPDWITDAVDAIADLNARERNIYVVRNPLRDGYSGAATDADVVAAFHLWADCDDASAAQAAREFDGPKWTAAVITGKVPSTRVHCYWELQDPITDLAAWRNLQERIAARLGSDRTVVNPSRIMRVAGTVSYPPPHKMQRGYIPELVQIKTDYSDRAPVTPDTFGPFLPDNVVSLPLSQMAMPQGPREATGFYIETGSSLDRDHAMQAALSGSEWHNNIIKLVASYVARGMTDPEIHALTQPLTLSGYTGDQTAREVQVAIDGARRKGWTPEPGNPFAARVETATAQADQPAAEPTFPTLYDFFDGASLPQRRWVYGNHYIRSFVSVLASAGGIGKTSLQIVEALAICTGRPLLGEEVKEPCNVWLVNLEDPLEEMQRRILAAMKHYNIKPDQIRGKLFVDAGRDFTLKFAAQTKAGIFPNDALIDHLLAEIPKRDIGMVFIDPFVAAHDVSENDNMAINFVISQIRRVADETQAAFGLVHHIRKGNGEEADIDSVRGAGALIGAARAARVINRIKPESAAGIGISATDAIGLFRVDDGKANLAPPAMNAVYRRMTGVQIENGEWIGVAVPFELPDEWAGMTESVVNDMLRIIGLGIPDPDGSEEYYSARPQDKERWAGNVIINYAFDNPDHRKGVGHAKKFLAKWIENGFIEEVTYRSEKQRKDRKGIIVKSYAGAQE